MINETFVICKNKTGLDVDFLTEEDRINGGIVVHFLIAFYAIFCIATVCDYYFIPAMKIMSKRFGLSDDIAGATLLATSAAAPGFFIALIACFLTKDDLGLVTIMGSCSISTHLLVGVCSLFAKQPVQLEWWPVTRDYMFYAASLISIIAIISDMAVHWYEATFMVSFYIIYLLGLKFQKSLRFSVKKFYKCIRCRDTNGSNKPENKSDNVMSIFKIGSDKLYEHCIHPNVIGLQITFYNQEKHDTPAKDVEKNEISTEKHQEANKETHESIELFTLPKGSIFNIAVWIIRWPMAFIYSLTIPDCTKPRFKNFYPLTFVISLIYIGGCTYTLTYMCTIVGETLKIPETVMAVTILSFCASIPDLYCSVQVFRNGYGNMALATGLGCNIIDILIDLGLPWVFQASFLSERKFVETESNSLTYASIFLFASAVVLYIAIAFNGYKISRRLAFLALIFYFGFLVVAIMLELNIFKAPSIITNYIPDCSD